MSPKAVTIRRLAPADEPEWRRMWASYLDFYETSVPGEVYAATFARLIVRDDETCHGLIALDAERPVGLVHYLYHRHMWRVEDVCYLQDLWVDPDQRGGGVGRALIEAVYAAADANRTPAVYWLTQDFNEAARYLYDRVGQATPFIKYVRPG